MSFRYFKQLNDQQSDEYLGNIWGWKNSLYGLGIILFFLSLYVYRLYTVAPVQPTQEKTTIFDTPSEVIKRDK